MAQIQFGERLHKLTHSRGFAACAVLMLLGVNTSTFAQAWQSERDRLDAEFNQLVDNARKAGATDISGEHAQIERLLEEYLQKVIKPALSQARTCRQRMDGVDLALSLERQAQVLGRSILDDQTAASLIRGTYVDDMYERCMNELYRTCIVEDNPLYALTMTSWLIGNERQKQLFGAGSDAPLNVKSELDPRITKCRGPWYEVRVITEDSGTEPDTGAWSYSDETRGWLGRGWARLSDKPPYSATRRAHESGHGAVCPDGGCGDVCHFTAVMEGKAGVSLSSDDGYRYVSINWRGDEPPMRLERNTCGHDDVPASLGAQLEGGWPDAKAKAPTDEPLPGGADPRVTEALDEWPRMFPSKTIELVEGDRALRLEVLRVCDGQELWERGSAECQQKWLEYLNIFKQKMPLPPWESKQTKH